MPTSGKEVDTSAPSSGRAQGAKKALGTALLATAQLVDYWPEYRAQAMAHVEEARVIAEETGDEELQLDVAGRGTRSSARRWTTPRRCWSAWSPVAIRSG